MKPKIIDYSKHVISFEDALRRAYPSRPIVFPHRYADFHAQLVALYGTVVQPSLTTRQPIKFTPRYMALAS